MGLFDEQFSAVREFMYDAGKSGRLREFTASGGPSWPQGSSIILEEDTALELGNPRLGSLTFLIWSKDAGVEDGRISLVGPDLGEFEERSVPFARVVMVGGEFADEYECYRDIRDAVYDIRLEGFMIRTMPSRQTIWCRVSKDALARGFSLKDVGEALIHALDSVEAVRSAEVLFVTSSAEDVRRLLPAAGGAQRIVDAMMKMYQEENFDCEECEYQEVCDEVMELKNMRKRLEEKKAGRG